MNCPICGVEASAKETVCSFCGMTLTQGGKATPAPAANPFQSPQTPVVARPRAASSAGNDAVLRMLVPIGRSGWAIAAGYFGLFSLVCFPAPIALILGVVAIRDLKLHPEKHGWGRAIFGLVMGLFFSAILAYFVIAGAIMKR